MLSWKLIGEDTTSINICSFVLPEKGGFPLKIIYAITPKDQISTFRSYSTFLTISGAIYKGEPSVSYNPPERGS